MSTRTIQDALDQEYSVSITYLPTGKTISFSGFVNSFKDTFKPEWQSENVYGRMDPIYTYKHTSRNINITIDVPSDSQSEAAGNFKKLQTLMSFAYPVYEKEKISSLTPQEIDASLAKANVSVSTADKMAGSNAMLMSRPPLVVVKYANLISSNNLGGRLLGKLGDITYDMDKEMGFFSENGNLIPKYFSLSLELDVIHTQPLGWEQDADTVKPRSKGKFPYGV